MLLVFSKAYEQTIPVAKRGTKYFISMCTTAKTDEEISIEKTTDNFDLRA